MTTNIESPLVALPTELIYHILTFLEPIFIVRTLRCVCKRFYGIAKSYDHFQLNFKSIDKSDFHFLCNFLRPNQIETLVLSDDDETPGQIEYFLSNFGIHRFSKLQILTLINIDDLHLKKFFKTLPKLSLKKLIIRGKDYIQNDNDIDTTDLASVLSMPTLRSFELQLLSFNLQRIDWPKNNRIQQLHIRCVTVDEFCSLLLFLPNLQDLTVEGLLYSDDISVIKESLKDLVPGCELISLTLRDGQIPMAVLDLLLSLTPTLQQLKLIRSISLSEFVEQIANWESFVECKLPFLTDLKLFLVHSNDFDHFGGGGGFGVPQIILDPSTIIELFQTPFWIENKRWFVTCDHVVVSRSLILYSSLMIDPQYQYLCESPEIRRYSSTTGLASNQNVILDNVQNLRLDLAWVMEIMMTGRVGLPRNYVFPNVETLSLLVPHQWPTNSLRCISALLNLSGIKTLIIESFNSSSSGFLSKLVKDMNNLRSVKINSYYHNYYSDSKTILDFTMSLDKNVKHLTFPVRTLDDMFVLKPCLRSLSSIKFQLMNYDMNASQMYMRWLKSEKGYHTYRLYLSSLSLWLDKNVQSDKNSSDFRFH